uniref:NADH-ubiquinone oxidoreductase chain 2 n=1 Tax=Physoderes impexa TaxID=1239050 RepID=A0A7I6HK28_9HEMI|nr:NADH dehydrogenase subunit 2 [Physoderes impexa]AGO28078.1 NADH dehydrogenase subunit 2 [Physoderes impexa]
MNNITKIMFMLMTMTGTILTFCSETWLGMWMGMEINLISFIPILHQSKNKSSSESCMIYFLTQSLGSIILLITVLSNSLIMKSPSMIEDLFKMSLLFSMMIKLGMPPFHFWFPEILEKMNWTNCMILMTWQKIAPMTVLMNIMNEQNIMMNTVIIMTVMTGAIGGLNQTSIRKIMAFSSINHMGWMIACLKFNNYLWINYLLLYSFILLMMTFIFKKYASYYINQLTSMSMSFTEKALITTLFMSLGGLPPFLGFLPKWMVIESLINQNLYFLLFIMIMSVLITLFYYLRLSSTILLINGSTFKWNNKKLLKKSILYSMISMNLSLPLLTFSL